MYELEENDLPELPYNQEILEEFAALADAAWKQTNQLHQEPPEPETTPPESDIEFMGVGLKTVDPALYPLGIDASGLFTTIKENEIIDRVATGKYYSPDKSPIKISSMHETLIIEHDQPDPMTDCYILAVRKVHSSGTGDSYLELQISEHRPSNLDPTGECNALYITEQGSMRILGNHTSENEYIIARAIKLADAAQEIGKILKKFKKPTAHP